MEVSINNRVTNYKIASFSNYLLPFSSAIIAIFLLKDYFIPGIQIALGIMVAPFIFKIQKHSYSYRYAYLFFLFLSAYYLLHIYVLLFISVGCLLFFSIECQTGKIGILPFLFLICISPAMHYISNVFTFSLRLELSKYAAQILTMVGMAVKNKGSYFVLSDGSSYSVDTACIGLNMFNTGLTTSLLLIGFSEQKTKKSLSYFAISLVFIFTIACLIFTNLIRIVTLVFFKSPPETWQHDFIGIASLSLYTVLPVYAIIYFIQKRNKQVAYAELPFLKANFKRNLFLMALCSTILIVVSQKIKNQIKYTIKDQKLYNLHLPEYTKTTNKDGIAEFRKEGVLIYIKPASHGYESDHPPSMCWQGAGFQLENISSINVNGYTILSAILKRDKLVQYTAWWYDNGKNKTINQFEWRFATGEPYRIINITTKSKSELDDLCRLYLSKNLFSN